MKLDYDDVFKISIRAMKINKSHPSVKRDKKWMYNFLFFHGMFTIVFSLVMYNIIFHNIRSQDFDETCKNGVLSVVYFVVSFQYTIMLWKQEILFNLMTLMKRDYESAQSLAEDEQDIIYKYSRKSAYVCKQCLALSISACCVFPLKNVIQHCYYWIIGEAKLIPLYDLIYPEIIERNKENIYVYLALYALLLFYGVYSAFMFTAFVPLGPSFMLHACGQLEIVEQKIEKLFQGDSDDVEGRLKAIIKQMQSIYSFVDQINLSFRVAYELTLKATTIILPLTFYEVLEAIKKEEIPLEFMSFIIGGILMSSSPCFFSDLLMEKSENVRLAIYSCGWESVYNQKVRNTIVIMLIRALKPNAIRTIFRTVCLEALTDLFQQSYTIFNLMNAMWK